MTMTEPVYVTILWYMMVFKYDSDMTSCDNAFYWCRFRVDYALSREQKNKKGGKMYIQDKVEEYADEVFDLLDNGAHIYFCGLKGMMPGELPHCMSHVMYGATFVGVLASVRVYLAKLTP